MNETVHTPVLLQELLSSLQLQKNDNVIDATVGGAGMAEAVLELTAPHGKLFGIDKDTEALKRSQKRLAKYKDRVILQKGNFRNIDTLVKKGFSHQVKAIFADFGISSDQLEDKTRGISFRHAKAPLDMRMDVASHGITAREIINSGREEDIADILFHYGDEKKARTIARAIIEARKKKNIESVSDLTEIIETVVTRKGKLHPATKSMQALRIAVNDEIEAIKEFLPKAFAVLPEGGVLSVITFHSLEDRAVKEFFKKTTKEKHAVSVIKKFAKPTRAEILTNPRSRSAKLRSIKKLK